VAYLLKVSKNENQCFVINPAGKGEIVQNILFHTVLTTFLFILRETLARS
jgi:hypothetical protein